MKDGNLPVTAMTEDGGIDGGPGHGGLTDEGGLAVTEHQYPVQLEVAARFACG